MPDTYYLIVTAYGSILPIGNLVHKITADGEEAARRQAQAYERELNGGRTVRELFDIYDSFKDRAVLERVITGKPSRAFDKALLDAQKMFEVSWRVTTVTEQDARGYGSFHSWDCNLPPLDSQPLDA